MRCQEQASAGPFVRATAVSRSCGFGDFGGRGGDAWVSVAEDGSVEANGHDAADETENQLGGIEAVSVERRRRRSR